MHRLGLARSKVHGSRGRVLGVRVIYYLHGARSKVHIDELRVEDDGHAPLRDGVHEKLAVVRLVPSIESRAPGSAFGCVVTGTACELEWSGSGVV